MPRFLVMLICVLAPAIACADDAFRDCTASEEAEIKIRACTAVIESGDPAHLALAHMNRGQGYLLKRKFDRALADLQTSLELNPQLAYSWHLRGTAHVAKGAHAPAFEAFTRAVEIEPSFIVSYKARGDLYMQTGDAGRALADYSKAIETAESLGRPDPALYCARSLVYYTIGNTGLGDQDDRAADQVAGEPNACD